MHSNDVFVSFESVVAAGGGDSGPIILALQGLKRVDRLEFEASLDHRDLHRKVAELDRLLNTPYHPMPLQAASVPTLTVVKPSERSEWTLM